MNKFKVALACNLVILGAMSAIGNSKPKFATATDLYAKRNLGTCCRLVTQANVLQANLQTSSTGTPANIQSNGGSIYFLYEDASCTRAVFFHGC